MIIHYIQLSSIIELYSIILPNTVYMNSNTGTAVCILIFKMSQILSKCNLRWPEISHYLPILNIQESYVFKFFRDAG